MAKISAGLLMFRRKNDLSVFLVHPGGPFFKNKDLGSWTIPKGLQEPGEKLLSTACREFNEETGLTALPPLIELGSTKLKGGKIVYAWAFETTAETVSLVSNTFQMQWPPKSGKMQQFAEIDRADFFDVETAKLKINEEQKIFIERLVHYLE